MAYPGAGSQRHKQSDEEKITKKILFILLAAAVCLSLLFTVFAYFDDTEVSTGNSFQAGTWSVDVSGGGNSAWHTFQNLVDGQSGMETWVVTNNGTIPAYVDLNISVSESVTGDLGDYLMTYLYVAGGPVIHSTAPINDIAGNYNLNLPLLAGESKVIALEWNVSAGYIFDEDDSVVFTIYFDIKPAP